MDGLWLEELDDLLHHLSDERIGLGQSVAGDVVVIAGLHQLLVLDREPTRMTQHRNQRDDLDVVVASEVDEVPELVFAPRIRRREFGVRLELHALGNDEDQLVQLLASHRAEDELVELVDIEGGVVGVTPAVGRIRYRGAAEGEGRPVGDLAAGGNSLGRHVRRTIDCGQERLETIVDAPRLVGGNHDHVRGHAEEVALLPDLAEACRQLRRDRPVRQVAHEAGHLHFAAIRDVDLAPVVGRHLVSEHADGATGVFGFHARRCDADAARKAERATTQGEVLGDRVDGNRRRLGLNRGPEYGEAAAPVGEGVSAGADRDASLRLSVGWHHEGYGQRRLARASHVGGHGRVGLALASGDAERGLGAEAGLVRNGGEVESRLKAPVIDDGPGRRQQSVVPWARRDRGVGVGPGLTAGRLEGYLVDEEGVCTREADDDPANCGGVDAQLLAAPEAAEGELNPVPGVIFERGGDTEGGVALETRTTALVRLYLDARLRGGAVALQPEAEATPGLVAPGGVHRQVRANRVRAALDIPEDARQGSRAELGVIRGLNLALAAAPRVAEPVLNAWLEVEEHLADVVGLSGRSQQCEHDGGVHGDPPVSRTTAGRMLTHSAPPHDYPSPASASYVGNGSSSASPPGSSLASSAIPSCSRRRPTRSAFRSPKPKMVPPTRRPANRTSVIHRTTNQNVASASI